MSFGWSASDIAVAIQLLWRVGKALNDTVGSVQNYRETAVRFEVFTANLNQLQRTIDDHESGRTTLTPDQVASLVVVISAIKPQMTVLESMLEKFVGFKPDATHKMLRQWGKHQFKKVKWNFTQEEKVRDLIEKISIQLIALQSVYQSIGYTAIEAIGNSIAIQQDVLARNHEEVKSNQVEMLKHLTTLLEKSKAMDETSQGMQTSVGPADGVPNDTASIDSTSTTTEYVPMLDVHLAMLHLNSCAQPPMNTAAAAKPKKMKVDTMFMKKIESWLSGEAVPRLWLSGRNYKTINAILLDVAQKRNRHVITHFCRHHRRDGTSITHENRFISLVYSLLSQLFMQLPKGINIPASIGGLSFNTIDGGIETIELAISYVQELILFFPQCVIIIDGFQFLVDNGSSARVLKHVRSLFSIAGISATGKETGEDGAVGNQAMGPRILLGTDGNSSWMMKTVASGYMDGLDITRHTNTGPRDFAWEMLRIEW